MLVYGDSERIQWAGCRLENLCSSLSRLSRMPPGLDRHTALVTAFIEAGQLVQGHADAEFESRGFDLRSPVQDAGANLLLALARAIDFSWRNDFGGEMRVTADPFQDLVDGRLHLRIRRPEGYAFYALYPESYIEAARRSGLGPRTCIIGIRSIGVGLGALVAAALNAPAPLSVRPVGHPFRRELRLGTSLVDEIRASSADAFAIVDEGPGLSGSSFGAVADWLEGAGVGRRRIHFFPSHAGDLGPQASPSHVERWRGAPRHVVSSDELLLRAMNGRPKLETWIADLVGPLDAPLDDISGGTWRKRRYETERHWPASMTGQERRKFIARSGGVAWLAKFAGLGAEGICNLESARQLHRAGFGTEPAGLCHGFLVERWIEGASSLDRVEVGRDRLVDHLGAYLGFRAHELAAEGNGASLAELGAMARHNVREVLGEAAVRALGRRLGGAEMLQRRVRPAHTDNRMHRHEWLAAGDRLIKTDAIDHARAHDLVGCQDIAWDVAGAAIEFDLSQGEIAAICAGIAHRSGRTVDRELLAFLVPCYLAFQLGASLMAVSSVDPEEARRLRITADRYRTRMIALLQNPALT